MSDNNVIQMQPKVQMPMKTTMVLISAKIANGDEVSQILPVNHQDGASDGAIFAFALKQLMGMGGILVDIPTGVKFYPIFDFSNGITFEIKKVILAGAPVPQLVQ